MLTAQFGSLLTCRVYFPILAIIVGLAARGHLGDSMPPQEGFRYWVTHPKGHTHQFYYDKAIWEGNIYEEPHYFTDAITGHVIDFLKQGYEGNFFPFRWL